MTAREHKLWMDVALSSRRGRWYRPSASERRTLRRIANHFQRGRGSRVRVAGVWGADLPTAVKAREAIEASARTAWSLDAAMSDPAVSSAVDRLGRRWASVAFDLARR